MKSTPASSVGNYDSGPNSSSGKSDNSFWSSSSDEDDWMENPAVLMGVVTAASNTHEFFDSSAHDFFDSSSDDESSESQDELEPVPSKAPQERLPIHPPEKKAKRSVDDELTPVLQDEVNAVLLKQSEGMSSIAKSVRDAAEKQNLIWVAKRAKEELALLEAKKDGIVNDQEHRENRAKRSLNDGLTPVSQDEVNAMLIKQSEAVCSFAKSFHDASQKQSLLFDAKRAKYQLGLLKEARKHGIINDQEYKEKVKDLIKL